MDQSKRSNAEVVSELNINSPADTHMSEQQDQTALTPEDGTVFLTIEFALNGTIVTRRARGDLTNVPEATKPGLRFYTQMVDKSLDAVDTLLGAQPKSRVQYEDGVKTLEEYA